MAVPGGLIIVGSGPGVGSHVAAAFARQGFEKVVLMSRNEDRLKDDAFMVKSLAPGTTVNVVTVDLVDTEQVEEQLHKARQALGETPLECIFFNAARAGRSKLLEWPVESLQRDLHISVVSLYTVVRWGIPQLLELANNDSYKPTLLVTSGISVQDPVPELFSLAACGAAQYNIMASCAKEFGPQGVNCGIINIGEHLGDTYPVSSAPAIAEEAWAIYNQQQIGRHAIRSIVDGELKSQGWS